MAIEEDAKRIQKQNIMREHIKTISIKE